MRWPRGEAFGVIWVFVKQIKLDYYIAYNNETILFTVERKLLSSLAKNPFSAVCDCGSIIANTILGLQGKF